MTAYQGGKIAAIFPLHGVLVITDLGPASTNALWRACEQEPLLRLLQVGGERKRMAQAHKALEDFHKQVRARLGIEL